MKLKIEGLKYGMSGEVDLDAMSDAWLAWAVSNGVRQSVGDADAGKANTPEGKAAVEAKLRRILAGEVPTGGGPRTDPLERHLRLVVEDLLRLSGVKATDAQKAARTPRDGFQVVLKAQCAAQGLTYSEAVLNKNWPVIVAQAEEALAAETARKQALAKLDLGVEV